MNGKQELVEREYPGYPRVGVCAIVIRNNRILLVKRGIAPSLGQWAMPGGSVKLGETLKEAVERETQEETGVVVHAGEPGCTLDFMECDESGSIRYHFVIVYIHCEYFSGEPSGASDATEARWFSRSELEGGSITRHTDRALRTIGFL